MAGSPHIDQQGVGQAQPEAVTAPAQLGSQVIRGIEDDALTQQARLVLAGPLPKERGRLRRWWYGGA